MISILSPFRPSITSSQAFSEMPFNKFDSQLEVPTSGDPRQNAWLTVSVRVKLEFVDSTNPQDVIINTGSHKVAKDADDNYFAFQNWDAGSKAAFTKGFVAAEKWWNFKFLLITPINYDQLDFDSRDLNYRVRPNILCLFRLNVDKPSPHQTIKIVRLDPNESSRFASWVQPAGQFRSHSTLYKDSAVNSATVGHELGHLIGQSHIKGLEAIMGQPGGLAKCVIKPASKDEINDNDCYGTTPEEKENLMGGKKGLTTADMGTKKGLTTLNAISWQKRLTVHCPGTFALNWPATMNVSVPPRKIPMGAAVVGTTRF